MIQGKSLVIVGFPEYYSKLIALDPLNTDVTAPARHPTA